MGIRPNLSLSRIRRRWWVVAAVLLLIVGLGSWRLVDPGSDGDEPTLATATLSTMRTTVTGSGTLAARRHEELAFSSSGEVTALLVEAGDEVTKGQVLARIDPTALQAERDAAAARVQAAEATVADSDEADASRAAADRSSLVAARAELASADAALDDAVLRAPFGGAVTAVGFDVGDRVGSSSGSAPAGASAVSSASAGASDATGVTLLDTGRYLVEATVAAAQVDQVEKGQAVEVSVTGSAGPLEGTVTRVGRVATVSSGGSAQYDVTVRLSKDATGLYVGSSAQIEIVVGQESEALTVPSSAIRTDDDGGSHVLLADGTRRDVELGAVRGTQTEIIDGLDEGEQVQVTEQAGRRGGRDGQMPDGFPGELPEGFPSELPEGFTPPGGGAPQFPSGGGR